MELIDAILGRRSIRSFKSQMVPLDVITHILDKARWSPSWGNTQPYHIHVIMGEKLERFRKRNRENFLNNVPKRSDIPMPEVWPEVYKKRYMGLGRSVLQSLSIKREDMEARKRYYADMYSLFGAPVLLIFTVEREINIEYAMLDVGLFIQNVCLLAYDKGLGTCILANSSRYPELIREISGIPKSQLIVIGVALGYPMEDAPVNNFKRERANLDEIVTWHVDSKDLL